MVQVDEMRQVQGQLGPARMLALLAWVEPERQGLDAMSVLM